MEDQNDNGSLESGEDTINPNSILDGDRVIYPKQAYINYTQDLTVFDIDNDGLVELPLVGDPDNIDPNFEYTKEHVLKHTITHEMGHAVGIDHDDQDETSLMYIWSVDWSRDQGFIDESKAQIQIHNN